MRKESIMNDTHDVDVLKKGRSSMKRFQDRVELATGGPSGIGKATALAFAVAP